MAEKEQNTDTQSKNIPQGKQNESAQENQQGQKQTQEQQKQTNPVPDYPEPEPSSPEKQQQPKKVQKKEEVTDGFVKRISSKRGILSAVTALALVLSVPAIVGAAGMGIISLSVVTQGWFMMYSTIALMGAVRLFGKDTLQSVREAQGGE